MLLNHQYEPKFKKFGYSKVFTKHLPGNGNFIYNFL